MKITFAGLLAMLMLFAFARVANAHSIPLNTNPAQGVVLTKSPGRVKMMFSLELVSGKSMVRVLDHTGKTVDLGNGHVDLNDASHQNMIVDLPSDLPAGVYTVTWRVTTSVEAHVGHITEGEFEFAIGAGHMALGETDPYPWRYIGEDTDVSNSAVAPVPSEGAQSPLSLIVILAALVVLLPASVIAGLWLISRRRNVV